jgi:hypothetical protein
MTYKSTILLAAACLSLSLPVHAADAGDDTNSALAACARIDDDVARMRCYDALGERALAGSNTEAASTSAATATSEQAPAEPASDAPVLPGTLGGARFESESGQGKSAETGLVTACEQGKDKRLIFYFEGGQVWKQSDSKRLRFDECRFEVTIAKDLLGYKMNIPEESTKVRVSRRR